MLGLGEAASLICNIYLNVAELFLLVFFLGGGFGGGVGFLVVFCLFVWGFFVLVCFGGCLFVCFSFSFSRFVSANRP